MYSEEERLDALESGVRCAVLAPAGPQRSRLLALYYKDERTKKLPNFPVLEKMYLYFRTFLIYLLIFAICFI